MLWSLGASDHFDKKGKVGSKDDIVSQLKAIILPIIWHEIDLANTTPSF